MSSNTQPRLYHADTNPSLKYAKKYLEAGYSPIPVRAGSKRPSDTEWQRLRLKENELEDRFTPGTNVGVVLGDASTGLVDVDLDNQNALALAPYFLPDTEFKFGHKSRPASHWVYRVPSAAKTQKFTADGTIIEVRGNGGQTVFPGSVHEGGEPVEFSNHGGGDLPVAATTDWGILIFAARKIAIGSALLDRWNKGKRHDICLAIAGMLVRKGWAEPEVIELIQAVAQIARDEEVESRLNDVRTTFERHRNGQTITSYSLLANALGVDNAKYIGKFIGEGGCDVNQPFRPANSNTQWSVVDFSTDDDAAKTFSEHSRSALRYCAASKQWYSRNVDVFDPVADAIAQGFVSDFSQMAYAMLGHQDKFPKVLKSRGRINSILELSRSRLRIHEDIIDQDRNLVGMSDGKILDLRNRGYVSGEGSFVTKKLGTHYDEAASCPRWIIFLNTIFDGNEEIISFVQRAVGYSLSGETGEQCLFLMTGTGANGKSTFINALRTIFGDYAGTTPMQTLTVMHHSNGQTNDLAMMEGRRFVSASDGETGQRLAEAKIKNMTGGDRIACRALYKDFREFSPQFKLWVAANDLPNVSGTDEAIWRRIRVITFPVTIPVADRDPGLLSALAQEAPGILNWALAGYSAWKLTGLNPPAGISDATTNYRAENDSVGQFIEARCERRSDAKSTSKELYSQYTEWCEDSGHEQIKQVQFGKELGRKGFASCRMRTGSAWSGIAVKASG